MMVVDVRVDVQVDRVLDERRMRSFDGRTRVTEYLVKVLL
jgi:hypothetical protein